MITLQFSCIACRNTLFTICYHFQTINILDIMARCYYPIWSGHWRQFVMEQDRKGNHIKILDMVDRVLGRDNLDYVLAFVRGETVSLDPHDLADIFKDEDVCTYVERIINSGRTIQDMLDELHRKGILEELALK
jgi:hypothetical protein